LQEKLNVGSKEVFKAGSAPAARVAKRGETCGALTGAIMTIGTIVGQERPEDKEHLQFLWRLLIRSMPFSEKK
jgi:hypothetical protein